ncbi:Mariner Mos1 transposase [Eumeta japonica]|uniref:Mariner Mos1 transposase n=1 Tax=Eumeta variegata TaxID=151549 RepID=A0A4C1Z7M2_EUMVA|nr:Mariner Mos1 transposase [Eumeta japonica]
MGISWPCFHVDGQTEYSRFQGHVQYLVGPARCSDKMILQHDNARPHVAKVVKTYLETCMSWEVLPHPPYSLNIAPSDYYLFRSMVHCRSDQHFRS